jgi:hypothetical protein
MSNFCSCTTGHMLLSMLTNPAPPFLCFLEPFRLSRTCKLPLNWILRDGNEGTIAVIPLLTTVIDDHLYCMHDTSSTNSDKFLESPPPCHPESVLRSSPRPSPSVSRSPIPRGVSRPNHKCFIDCIYGHNDSRNESGSDYSIHCSFHLYFLKGVLLRVRGKGKRIQEKTLLSPNNLRARTFRCSHLFFDFRRRFFCGYVMYSLWDKSQGIGIQINQKRIIKKGYRPSLVLKWFSLY